MQVRVTAQAPDRRSCASSACEQKAQGHSFSKRTDVLCRRYPDWTICMLLRLQGSFCTSAGHVALTISTIHLAFWGRMAECPDAGPLFQIRHQVDAAKCHVSTRQTSQRSLKPFTNWRDLCRWQAREIGEAVHENCAESTAPLMGHKDPPSLCHSIKVRTLSWASQRTSFCPLHKELE